MFCSKCGAAVTGNYCSVCGQKIRTPAHENYLELQRARQAFTKQEPIRPHSRYADPGISKWRLRRRAWEIAECHVAETLDHGSFNRTNCPAGAGEMVTSRTKEVYACLLDLFYPGEGD